MIFFFFSQRNFTQVQVGKHAQMCIFNLSGDSQGDSSAPYLLDVK